MSNWVNKNHDTEDTYRPKTETSRSKSVSKNDKLSINVDPKKLDLSGMF